MRTAAEIEKAYKASQVESLSDGGGGPGVLTLAGRDSRLVLTSKTVLQTDRERKDWIDISVKAADSSTVLLLNAVVTQQSYLGMSRREWQTHLFPNIVVLNAEALPASGKIREISFKLEGLDELFAYEIAESQHLYNATSKQKSNLNSLRKNETHYPRDYAFFNPTDVVLVHRLPLVLNERIGSKRYQIFVGHSQKHHLRKITLEPYITATILYDTGVSIPRALDDIWVWRRFFQQMAMRPLRFLGMACRGSHVRRQHWSEIYLPNLALDPEPVDDPFLDIGPRNNPLGEWKDRGVFGAAMKSWLERDSERRLFRVRVDQVIEVMQRMTASNPVAILCSAIETLDAFKRPATLTNTDLAALVDAAAAVGNGISPPVDRKRIEGLLGMLQHTSLPQRLKSLTQAVAPEIPAQLGRRVTSAAYKFRTFEAHGARLDDMTQPLLAPTLHILAAMCVLWDLKTSGFPATRDHRNLAALTHIHLFQTSFAKPPRARREDQGGQATEDTPLPDAQDA